MFPIPEGGFIFHMHWEGKEGLWMSSFGLALSNSSISGIWGDAFELAIDSFMATQNLAAGHRMIFWHGKTTPPPKRVLDRYAELAPDHISFKPLNHAAIAKGTCYERKSEWTSAKYRERAGMGSAAVSNLLRTMLLAKVSASSNTRNRERKANSNRATVRRHLGRQRCYLHPRYDFVRANNAAAPERC